MICGHCGHLNNEDEARCIRCGRRLGEPRHRSRSGDSQERQDAAAKGAPWREELHRRLDAYRRRRDTAGPNVISIERGAGFPNPGPVNDRLDAAPTAAWPDRRTAEAFSPPAAAANMPLPHPFLPPPGIATPRRPQAVAVEAAFEPRSPTPNEVRCSAAVAPLPIRFLAGVLDAALLMIALGAFWGVFHWLGGAISPDREGARAVGITAILLTGFYWAFHVGFFGETPGMTWLGLRLLNFHGRHANGRQRAARALGLLFSTTTLGIGFAWALLDDEKLTWHDRMSKTFISRDGAVGFRARSRLVEAHPRSPSFRNYGA